MQYIYSLQGQIDFILKDKSPKSLLEAQELASQIEADLAAFKLDNHSKKVNETRPRATYR